MKKIYFAHNVCLNSGYDFNIVKNALKSSNFIIVDNIEEADTYIYAGCGVRGIWVDGAIQEINEALEKNKNLEIIATGCFSAIEPVKILNTVETKHIQLNSFSGIVKNNTDTDFEKEDLKFSQIQSLDDESNNLKRKRLNELKKSIITDLQKIDKKYGLSATKKYKEITKGFIFYNDEEITENITITRGCPYKCTYCSIPVGRGNKYTSVSLGNIVKKIEKAIERGVKNFLLLGDELGNYGLGTNDLDFSKLLIFLLEKYDISLSIRYIEPKPFLEHFETIQQYCKTGQIKLLYIPIQSGSNKILKLMNRTYKISQEFVEKILYLKNNTDVVLYTNWMIGFPSETREDIDATKQLMKQLDCHINMVIPFSERPNTLAKQMQNKISVEEKVLRHKQLFDAAKILKVKQFDELLNKIDSDIKEDIVLKIMEAENYCVQID